MAKQNPYKRKVIPNRADERETRTGMRQSKGAMIAKIVLGGLFLAVSFDPSEGEWSLSYFLFCLVLGGGLIALTERRSFPFYFTLFRAGKAPRL